MAVFNNSYYLGNKRVIVNTYAIILIIILLRA